jgi:hypothetical protein
MTMKGVSGKLKDYFSLLHPAPIDVTIQSTFYQKAVSQNTLTSRRVQPNGRRRRSRRLVVLYCCLGLFAMIMSLLGLTLYFNQNYSSQYQRDIDLAQGGMRHLQIAEGLIKNLTRGSLDSQSIAQARQEFTKAFSNFTRIENDLDQIPGYEIIVPKYGSLLSAALKLVPLAKEVSQLGMLGCDALTIIMSQLHESLNVKAQGITMADLTIIKTDLTKIQRILSTAADQIGQLQPSDLQVDARLGPAVATFRTILPRLQTGLQVIQTVLSVAPTLLGIVQPASFLIEQLDSTELRPGGGFIGNYGIATILGGKLTNVHMTDTYLLDKPFEYSGHSIPYPSAYQWFSKYLAPASWSLRDSNLDADFPTAARYAEQIYQTEGGSVPLQGVIAITPWFIQNALKITGPIYVNEYHESITAQNLVDRIHFHQLQEDVQGGDTPSPDGHSSLRKRFTELLFEHFFAKVRQVWFTAPWQFANLFHNSLLTKDFQIYLNSNVQESLLQSFKVASTIQSPQGDGLFIVDANVSGGKPNNFIHYNLQDEVSIDASGNALHKTKLTYFWPASTDEFQNGFGSQSLYHDYIRIYIPSNSVLVAQNGVIPEGMSEAFGRNVWAGLFILPYGQSRTITLSWIVHSAAMHDAQGWHYHYLIQRQAGIIWHVNFQVTLPFCAHIANKQHNWTSNQYLITDLNIGVNYNC